VQQTGLANRCRELLERGRINVAARLIGIGANVGDGELDQTALALGFFASGSQQGFEAPAETTATSKRFRHAGTSGSGSAAGGVGGAGAEAPRSPRRISAGATARWLFAPTGGPSYSRIGFPTL